MVSFPEDSGKATHHTNINTESHHFRLLYSGCCLNSLLPTLSVISIYNYNDNVITTNSSKLNFNFQTLFLNIFVVCCAHQLIIKLRSKTLINISLRHYCIHCITLSGLVLVDSLYCTALRSVQVRVGGYLAQDVDVLRSYFRVIHSQAHVSMAALPHRVTCQLLYWGDPMRCFELAHNGRRIRLPVFPLFI